MAIRLLGFVLALAGCVGLVSCATAPETQTGDQAFRFTVMLYKEPVEVASWRIDPAQAANPEGAAFNIIAAMQRGDVEQWRGDWELSERPKITPEYRRNLAQKMGNPQGRARVLALGRVVADAEIIIELSVRTPQQTEEKVQLPLKRAEGQWWALAMDPKKCEFLNWETSNNKIVA